MRYFVITSVILILGTLFYITKLPSISLEQKLEQQVWTEETGIEISKLLETAWDRLCILPLGGDLYYSLEKDNSVLGKHFEDILYSSDIVDEVDEGKMVYLLAVNNNKLVLKEKIGSYYENDYWYNAVGKHGNKHYCTTDKKAFVSVENKSSKIYFNVNWEESYEIKHLKNGGISVDRL